MVTDYLLSNAKYAPNIVINHLGIFLLCMGLWFSKHGKAQTLKFPSFGSFY